VSDPDPRVEAASDEGQESKGSKAHGETVEGQRREEVCTSEDRTAQGGQPRQRETGARQGGAGETTRRVRRRSGNRGKVQPDRRPLVEGAFVEVARPSLRRVAGVGIVSL
jgi:hypothetical protein